MAKTPRIGWMHTKIAGVTARNGDQTSRQMILARCRSGEPIRLVREPKNRYDRNAVAVRRETGEQLGYLNRELAEEFAGHLDSGGIAMGLLLQVTGSPLTTLGANLLLAFSEAGNSVEDLQRFLAEKLAEESHPKTPGKQEPKTTKTRQKKEPKAAKTRQKKDPDAAPIASTTVANVQSVSKEPDIPQWIKDYPEPPEIGRSSLPVRAEVIAPEVHRSESGSMITSILDLHSRACETPLYLPILVGLGLGGFAVLVIVLIRMAM